MKQLADKNKIKWQNELLPAGGTDTAGMQRMATYGTIAGAVSIPTRHIHSVIEMAHKADIRGNIDLLKLSISSLDTYDWSFR
jgi:endoglucanase